MNFFSLSLINTNPALAQQDRVETLVQTPSSHSHGITAVVFFSGECRGFLTPLNPANLSYAKHRECGRVQVSTVTPVSVFIMTSPVESFSLKKLFYYQEENGFKDSTMPFFCFKRVHGFPLHQAMYLGVWVETLLVGTLNTGRQKMARLGD